MRAIRNPTGIRERRLSALQLEVLEAAPIEARKTPPRAHWSYYIGKRPVSASVKILIRDGFLILEERAPRRGGCPRDGEGSPDPAPKWTLLKENRKWPSWSCVKLRHKSGTLRLPTTPLIRVIPDKPLEY